jgi:hemerythrin-like domain-containing protein
MAQISSLAGRELALIEAGRTADLDMLEDIMCYVTGYPDTHHHPTEDIVFEQLKLRVPEAADEIDAILAEHRQLIESGTRFLEAIRALEEEVIMVRSDFVLAGRTYLSLLERHMNIEESQLFPLAQSKLTVEDWQRLSERIEQRPDPLFGASLDKDYHRLRQRIEAHRTEHHDEPA